MLRLSLIIALSGIILLPACGGRPSGKPVYEQVKIYELAPSTSSGLSQKHLRGLIELDTFILELPAVNYPLLQKLWNTKLSDSPLKYHSAKSFKASGFIAGVVTVETLNEISKTLQLAKCRKT